jgi:hypothetical protein
VKKVKEILWEPIERDFIGRVTILDFLEHNYDKTRVSFSNMFGKIVMLGDLKFVDQCHDLHYIV